MSAEVYDEVEIEDLDFEPDNQTFYYPCPCGDKFVITLSEIGQGKDIAKCPSCSLTIRVVYDTGSYQEYLKIAEEITAWYPTFIPLLFLFKIHFTLLLYKGHLGN